MHGVGLNRGAGMHGDNIRYGGFAQADSFFGLRYFCIQCGWQKCNSLVPTYMTTKPTKY